MSIKQSQSIPAGRSMLPRKPFIAIVSSVFMSSAAITIQASSSKLNVEKDVNYDQIKRPHVIFYDQDPISKSIMLRLDFRGSTVRLFLLP